MNFLMEYKWTLLFYTSLILIIYLNRKKLDKEGPFMYLYRTQIGIRLMDTLANRYRRLIRVLGYIGIAVAYIGFIVVSIALAKTAIDLIMDKPDVIGGGPALPGFEIAGLGIRFPLVIGWISLFIIIVVHEFSHGVVARAHDVHVKSSGIAFFGPILGAFVEPDDKQMEKKPHKVQHSVFAAGPVSNFVLAIVMIAALWAINIPLDNIYPAQGVNIRVMENTTWPAALSDMPHNVTVTGINDMDVTTTSSLGVALNAIRPGEQVNVKTLSGTYEMTAAAHPDDPESSYLGIWVLDEYRVLAQDTPTNTYLKQVLIWLSELAWWTWFISLNIGLVNLFPIFITDGAQMLRRNFEYIFKRERAHKLWGHMNLLALFILLIIVFLNPLRDIVEALLGLL